MLQVRRGKQHRDRIFRVSIESGPELKRQHRDLALIKHWLTPLDMTVVVLLS